MTYRAKATSEELFALWWAIVWRTLLLTFGVNGFQLAMESLTGLDLDLAAWIVDALAAAWVIQLCIGRSLADRARFIILDFDPHPSEPQRRIEARFRDALRIWWALVNWSALFSIPAGIFFWPVAFPDACPFFTSFSSGSGGSLYGTMCNWSMDVVNWATSAMPHAAPFLGTCLMTALIGLFQIPALWVVIGRKLGHIRLVPAD